MFNIGPMELLVLALVGIVVLGPDRLPGFARDAARLLRTLRDMATGARQQLKDELGPEFADVDLRNLNPRTAVQRAVFGDEMPDFRKFSPSSMVRDAIFADEDAEAEAAAVPEPAAVPESAAVPEPSVSMTKPAAPMAPSANGSGSRNGARPRPRPRPSTHYDDDAT